MIWHVFGLVIFPLAVILLVLRIMIAAYRKKRSVIFNHNDHAFYHDELLKEVKVKKNKSGPKKQTNQVYYANYKNGEVIDKYILTKANSGRSLTFEYSDDIEEANFQIFCYDKKIKLLEVIEYSDIVNDKYSKSISLLRRCEYINIVEPNKGVDIAVNKQKKQPLLLIILDSVIFAAFLFTAIFIITIIFGGASFERYLQGSYLFSVVATIVIATGLNFVLTYRTYDKRSKRSNIWKNINL